MGRKFQLIDVVIENSESSDWDNAVLEWEITDWGEADNSEDYSCICGKENIIQLFEISNIKNGNVLYPIGSQCIKKFGREELADEVSAIDKMFKLQKAHESGAYIELSSELFSRKSLEYMYDNNAFNDTRYGTAEESYRYLVKMFNKRSKPTTGQQKKINAIIMNDIIPYCDRLINEKIK